MWPGVRPSICLASVPTAATDFVPPMAVLAHGDHRRLVEHDALAARRR